MVKGARQLSQLAAAIGRTADAAKYQKLYDDVRTAFIARFVSPDGKIGSDSQTGYILAFTNDLVPAGLIDVHLSTGFLGVDGLLPVLTKIGRADLAYRLLQNTSYPSWGYEIGWGATTVWERWNSINPDGTFNDVGMNSFNHYAYGAVGEWMYRTLAGVSAAEPGYKKVLIAPPAGCGHHRGLAPAGDAVRRSREQLAVDVRRVDVGRDDSGEHDRNGADPRSRPDHGGQGNCLWHLPLHGGLARGTAR